MDIPGYLLRKVDSNYSILVDKNYRVRAALWALRLLVDGKGYRFLIDRGGFKDDDILTLIGLEGYIDREITPREGQQLLKQRLSDLEQARPQPGLLDRNLFSLGETLGLDPVEQRVLAFLSILKQFEALNDTLRLFSSGYDLPPKQQLVALTGIALKLPQRQIAQALSNQSVLVRCRLLKLEGRGGEMELLAVKWNCLTASRMSCCTSSRPRNPCCSTSPFAVPNLSCNRTTLSTSRKSTRSSSAI